MTDFKNQLDLYLKELGNYMDGKLADCPSLEVDHVKVYINNSLAEEINRKKSLYRKHLSALKYGYVGDRRGLNGVRPIHKRDGRIHERAKRALEKPLLDEIVKRYNLSEGELKSVKVVTHDPSGRRIYGVMDKRNHKIILLGVDHYR